MTSVDVAGREPITSDCDVSIRLVVVAHTALHREGLRRALSAHGDLEVIASTGTARDAIHAVAQTDGDVAVIVDLSDETGGLRAAHDIADQVPDACLVGLSSSSEEDLAVAAAEAGVTALVGPDDDVMDLVAAINRARRGELHCSPRTSAILQQRLRSLVRESAPSGPLRLTTREIEIMTLIDRGLSNRQVAHRLSIELSTVKNHLHNIFEKLDVHDRSTAAARLRADGSIPRSARGSWVAGSLPDPV